MFSKLFKCFSFSNYVYILHFVSRPNMEHCDVIYDRLRKALTMSHGAEILMLMQNSAMCEFSMVLWNLKSYTLIF